MKQVSLDCQIRTERLILRRPLEEDVDLVFDASRYPGFNDGMLWDAPASKEDCIEPFLNNVDRWLKGKAYVFTIILQSSRISVGRIAIEESACGNSIGFWTHPKYQNFGYVTEALAALLQFCFETLDLEVIEACHADWNLASRRVLEKNGFRFKRHVEEGFVKNGEWVPEDVLALSVEQWRSRFGGVDDLEVKPSRRLAGS